MFFKKYKIINILLIITLSINIFLNNTILSNAATLDFTIIPDTNGYGSVSLDWSSYNYSNKNFKVYKSVDNGASFETVGIDYRLVTRVDVLQIAPNNECLNQMKQWMETDGYGKGIIKAESVLIDNFNANPNAYLKDSSGNWKYDVLLFGTWDSNGGKTLSVAGYEATAKFIEAGKGVILGHDTAGWTGGKNTSSYFNLLAQNYFGITGATDSGADTVTAHGKFLASNIVKISKTGLLTNYPWKIGELGDRFKIPHTHNSSQYANDATIWVQFETYWDSDSERKDLQHPAGFGKYNFYIATYNNTAMIMTGDTSGKANANEEKFIANLIFYMNQLLFNTYTTNDMSAQDVASPSTPTAYDNGTIINYSSSDLGSKYHYYVESYSKNDTTSTGLIDRSTTKQIEVKTGLKSYRYIFDNSASTTVTLTNGTETTSTSLTQPSNTKYFHVAAVDKAGNISTTKTIELDPVWTLTTNAGAGGLISYSETIENGKSTSVHIVPMSGYQLSTLTVDGASKTPVLTYDFWNVTTNHSIVATFTKTTNLTNYLNILKTKYSWITFK